MGLWDIHTARLLEGSCQPELRIGVLRAVTWIQILLSGIWRYRQEHRVWTDEHYKTPSWCQRSSCCGGKTTQGLSGQSAGYGCPDKESLYHQSLFPAKVDFRDKAENVHLPYTSSLSACYPEDILSIREGRERTPLGVALKGAQILLGIRQPEHLRPAGMLGGINTTVHMWLGKRVVLKDQRKTRQV